MMNAREKIELLGEASQGRMPPQERRDLENFLERLFRRSVSTAESILQRGDFAFTLGENRYMLVLKEAQGAITVPDGQVYNIQIESVRKRASYAGSRAQMSYIAPEYRVYVTYTSTEDLQNEIDENGLDDFIDELLDAYERAWAQTPRQA